MTMVFLVWINFCSAFAHPVYISYTNMDIDARKENIVLSIRIFTDDLETVLHNKYGIDGWIGTAKEHPDCRRLIGEYISERFTITANRNEKLSMTTDSMSIQEDALWIYMKAQASQTIHYVEIENRVLTDFFYSQTNLIIISTGQKEKPYKLDRKKYKIELSL